MAYYEGNIDDFKKFINGYSRNLVQSLTRKHKKNRTCSNVNCGKRTKLQAAHLRGKERPKLITEIIDRINISEKEDYIKIDLNRFEEEFIREHTPIDKTIIILCHEHHLEYDRINKNIDLTDIIPIESEDELKEYSELLDDEIMSESEDIKIGKLVQKEFIKLFDTNKVDEKLIRNLSELDYCKQNFKITFPVLKELLSEKSFFDKKDYQRYYKDDKLIFSFDDKKYLLTKEWKETHKVPFENWIKSL